MKKSDIFLAGAIVGGVAALLLTDKTGKQRREDIAVCRDQLIDKGLDIVDDIKNCEIYDNLFGCCCGADCECGEDYDLEDLDQATADSIISSIKGQINIEDYEDEFED